MATKWADKYEMTWSTAKYMVLQRPEQTDSARFRPAEQVLETTGWHVYLEALASASGVELDAVIHRIKATAPIA